MRMFPGRFPNEIENDLDIATLNRILAAQRVMQIEDARLTWLNAGGELSGGDWLRIREHDALVDDYTVKVTDARSGER